MPEATAFAAPSHEQGPYWEFYPPLRRFAAQRNAEQVTQVLADANSISRPRAGHAPSNHAVTLVSRRR